MRCSASAEQSALRVRRPPLVRRFSRFCGVSKATRLPCAMISTLSQMACTSLRMCELKMTVWVCPSSWIRSRISMICKGSRPTVGSSKIM